MIHIDLSLGQLILVILVWAVIGGFVEGWFRAVGTDTRKWWERRR
jgi:hypothetical protein